MDEREKLRAEQEAQAQEDRLIKGWLGANHTTRTLDWPSSEVRFWFNGPEDDRASFRVVRSTAAYRTMLERARAWAETQSPPG